MVQPISVREPSGVQSLGTTCGDGSTWVAMMVGISLLVVWLHSYKKRPSLGEGATRQGPFDGYVSTADMSVSNAIFRRWSFSCFRNQSGGGEPPLELPMWWLLYLSIGGMLCLLPSCL
ncbi:hypothetical protein B296_00036624 [Ensete ventricosum]|uniref:Uncharacterized protein n=1 Tax=Ensete ventricosum TaxID=4639 RepID=A0A426YZ80_ENSVE|nr:hypothetical protein B296_00036624 [Ensete ventricosum]